MNNKLGSIYDFYPHYTNERFRHPQVIWGTETKDAHYVYSDRLREWDYKKASKAMELAKEKFPELCAARIELYLSEYLEKPVEIVCILAGFNWSNGYPYQVFGYKEK